MLQLQICIDLLKRGSQGTCKSFIYKPDPCPARTTKIHSRMLAAVSPEEPKPTTGALEDHASPNIASLQEKRPPP